MPKHKDLKRKVRSRMQKTGESYTTARMRLLQKKQAAPAIDHASLAGMRDEAVRARTGKTWSEWTATLDAIDAHERPHREIARHLQVAHGLPGWWAQTVTVGYERIRGLREVGQRRDGAYEANKSKTFQVPLSRLYGAFADARERRQWLADREPVVRKATPERSMRLTWDDGTSVDIAFLSKGAAKSQVAVQHGKLGRKADVERAKTYWGERLTALASWLDSKPRAGKPTKKTG